MTRTAAVTATAIDAVRADRAALLDICAGLTAADWQARSGCPGWSVKDVISHLSVLFWLAADRSALPDLGSTPTERAQDIYVQQRRSWPADAVLADYTTISARALAALAGLAGLDAEVPLGDLGTYPLSVVPAAYAFDHYTHIRADLHAPRGPLHRDPPPADELRLAPALDWIEAALPQQNAGAIGALRHAVEIAVTGPGGRTLRVGPGEPASQVQTSSAALVLWMTQRSSWAAGGVTATGNGHDLTLVQALKVF